MRTFEIKSTFTSYLTIQNFSHISFSKCYRLRLIHSQALGFYNYALAWKVINKHKKK